MALLGLYNYNIFMYGTSFIHYLRFMTTRYYRTKYDFSLGHYLRDVIVFKIISDMHLISSYVYTDHHNVIPEIITIVQAYTMSTMYLIFNNMDDNICHDSDSMYIIYHLVALLGFYKQIPCLVNMHFMFYALIILQNCLI